MFLKGKKNVIPFLYHLQFAEHDQNMLLKEEFKRLQFLLSDESLVLLPEYTQRVEVS